MGKKKTGLIIFIVLLLIIVGVVATVGVMAATGKIAITSKQKLAKGFNDIGAMTLATSEESSLDEYQKMYEKPFKAETTITGSLDELNIADLNSIGGMDQFIEDLKGAIKETTITNVAEADLKNNIIKEDIQLEVGEIIEKISGSVEYNKDTISLRAKELNEKYLTIAKDDLDSSSEYEDFVEMFEALEMLCSNENYKKVEFTEEEKAHFEEYYKGIFFNYITDDMITEEKATITIDGLSKECSQVMLTLNKQQIVGLVNEYLNKFESDTTGKSILVAKLNSVDTETQVTEADLSDLVSELKDTITDLDDDMILEFSIYCSYFETYGFNIQLKGQDRAKITALLGVNTQTLNVSVNEEEIINATKNANEMNINLTIEELLGNIKVTNTGNQTVTSLEMTYAEEMKIKVTLTSEEITKTEIENSEKNSLKVEVDLAGDEVAFTLNIDNKLQFLNSVETTNISSSNSVNMITGNVSDIQMYITEFSNNGNALIQKAQQSKLVQAIMYFYSQFNSTSDMEDTNTDITTDITNDPTNNLSSVAAQTFNSSYMNYAGIQKGSTVKMLLQNISMSNMSNMEHQITVSIMDGTSASVSNTADGIQSGMANIDSSKQYKVEISSYDTEGYINQITITLAE